MTYDENAKKIWKAVFGDKEWAQDCFGTWMHRDAHSKEEVLKLRPGNSKKYDYSWNIDHIKPKASFLNESNADFFLNYEPMHRLNNLAKADNENEFQINGHEYKIVKLENGYGIIDVESGERVDWKAKTKY